MGYTLTANSVSRVKPYLDELVAAEGDMQWESTDPLLAYRIREGIAAAAHLKIEQYAKLTNKYIIRSRKNKVVAELRNRLDIDALRSGLAEPAEKLTIRDAISLPEIIGACVAHNADELYFPLAVLEEDELDKLKNYAKGKHLEVLDHEDEGITLRKLPSE